MISLFLNNPFNSLIPAKQLQIHLKSNLDSPINIEFKQERKIAVSSPQNSSSQLISEGSFYKNEFSSQEDLSERLRLDKAAKQQRRELLIQIIDRELKINEKPSSVDQDDISNESPKLKFIIPERPLKTRKKIDSINQIEEQLNLAKHSKSEGYFLDIRRKLFRGDNREIVRQALGVDLDEDLTLNSEAIRKLDEMMKSKFILLRLAPSKEERLRRLQVMFSQNSLVSSRFYILYISGQNDICIRNLA